MREETFWKVVESVGTCVEKEEDGTRTIEVQLTADRSQLIRIKLADLGDPFGVCATFGTLVGELKDLDCEHALRLNASKVHFGAIAVMDDMVVIRETLRLATCDPDEVLFAISELATLGDALEKDLSDADRF